MAMKGTTESPTRPVGCVLPRKLLKGHRASGSTKTAGLPHKHSSSVRLTAVLVYCAALTHLPPLIAS